MALTKVEVIDRIEVLEDGSIQVRRARYVEEDGVRISAPQYHRTAYIPGSDVAHEDARVQAIAAVDWTPGRVQAFREKQAASRLR